MSVQHEGVSPLNKFKDLLKWRIIVAGGDGTVASVLNYIYDTLKPKYYPEIGLVPLGTGNGTWGNVCVNGMTEETVSLICQDLNCGKSGIGTKSQARLQSAPNGLGDLKCRKYDSILWHCPSSPWGQNYCDNSNDVAHITCSGRQFLSTVNCIYTLP